MKKKVFSILFAMVMAVSLLMVPAVVSADEPIPTPEDFLGCELPVADFVVSYDQIYDYMLLLDGLSDRVEVVSIGETYRGQEMIQVVFSMPNNLEHLDYYVEINDKISDPRTLAPGEIDDLLKEAKVFFMVDAGAHSPELGNTQAAIPLAYYLATTDDPEILAALEDVIFVYTPCKNPDGLSDVVDWSEENWGTDYWRRPPYYGDFVSHDDNRAYQVLKPQHIESFWLNGWMRFKPEVTWDMHQGRAEKSIFILPLCPRPEALNPDINWIAQLEAGMLIMPVFTEMTAMGFEGLWFNTTSDNYYPGYGDSMPMLHHSAAATPEVGCTDYPELGFGAVYSEAFIVSSLKYVAQYKDMLLRNRYLMTQDQIETGATQAPYAWVLPLEQKDPVLAAQLANIMIGLGVEVHQLDHEATIAGAAYPEGSHVILLNQPYGNLVQTLFERKDYAEDTAGLFDPYDVVGFNLPLLMGVDAVRIDTPDVFSAAMTKVDQMVPSAGRIVGETLPTSFVLRNEMNNVATAVSKLHQEGIQVFWSDEPFTAVGESFPSGTFIIPVTEGVPEAINSLASDLNLTFWGVAEPITASASEILPPRLALYHGWTDTMQEGWTRMVLLDYEIPFERITDDDVRQGDLNDRFDVVIIPDMRTSNIVEGKKPGTYPEEYTGGIGEEGVTNLKDFAEAGGTLIVIDSAVGLITDYFDIGVGDAGLEDFRCPGSILAAVVNPDVPVGYGFANDPGISIFNQKSPILEVTNPAAKIIVSYASEGVLESGWLEGEEQIENRAVAVEVPVGEGKVDVFAFKVINRYQATGNFSLLFNAIFNSMVPVGAQTETEVGLTTKILFGVVSINVTPTFLDFGELAIGETSAIQSLTVENTGSLDVLVTASTTSDFYDRALWLDSFLVGAWDAFVATFDALDVDSRVKVPNDWTSGTDTETGLLIMWAEMA